MLYFSLAFHKGLNENKSIELDRNRIGFLVLETSEKLVLHPKVLCTPHLGASTVEAQKRVALEIAQQIVDGSEGKPMVGLVRAEYYFFLKTH